MESLSVSPIISCKQDIGKVIRIAGEIHCHILCFDGEKRGARIHSLNKNRIFINDYVLIQYRELDDLIVDILFIYKDDDDLKVIGSIFQEKSIELGEDAELGDNSDVLNYEKIPPRKTIVHHHFLFLILGVDEEEVYCDQCETMIEQGKNSWTCSVPYCHFDQCEKCAGLENDSIVNDDADFIDYFAPKFLIGDTISYESSVDKSSVKNVYFKDHKWLYHLHSGLDISEDMINIDIVD